MTIIHQDHVLDQDLVLKQINTNRIEVELSDHWSINHRPNGGYLMAVIAAAMQTCSSKSTTPIVTAGFIHACKPGRAVVDIQVISESGNFARLTASLVQNNKECVRAMGTFCSPPEQDPPCFYEQGPPQMASFEDSIPVPPIPDNGLFDHIDARLDPSCTGWITGDLSDTAQIRGWLGFKKKRTLDLPALLLFSDTYPPPVFAKFGPRAWVPTIEMSVNVRALPETQHLKVVFSSRFISAGLVEEDGELWDSNGNLIAISRQISKYRRGVDPNSCQR